MVIEMPKPFEIPPKDGRLSVHPRQGKHHGRPLGEAGRDEALQFRSPHHGKVWVRPPGSHWMENAEPGVAYSTGMGRNSSSEGNDIIGKFNPGLGAQNFDIDGSAKLIPKGSDFVFELHYTATGKPETDVSRVGLVLMKTAPLTRYYTSPGTPSAFNMVIPPHESNVEVVSESTVGADMKLVYIQPHAHLRGKDFELRLVYPTGEKQTVFKAKFDFNWQLGYDLAKPIVLPKGTKMILIAHYDNSANNPFNPDPEKEVRWGPQNWDGCKAYSWAWFFRSTRIYRGFWKPPARACCRPLEPAARPLPRLI